MRQFHHSSFTDIGIDLNTTGATVNPNINSFGVVTGTRDARVGLKLYF